MANLETFGVTVAMLQRHMNPTLDPAGIQIGALFSLTGVDSTTARVANNTISLTMPAGFAPVNANQLEGYKLYLNGNYGISYTIFGHSALNEANDFTGNFNLLESLPAASGDWDVVCQYMQSALTEAEALREITIAAGVVKSKLEPKYLGMIQRITGWLPFGNRELLGFTSGADITDIPMPFYRATKVRVWKNPEFEYEERRKDTLELAENVAFIVTHDDEALASTITFTAEPDEDDSLCVDFEHTLDPVPACLQEWTLGFAAINILTKNATINSAVDRGALQERRQLLLDDIATGVPQFDAISLYHPTKVQKRHGYGNIQLFRR